MFGLSQKDKNAALMDALTDDDAGSIDMERVNKALAKGADPNAFVKNRLPLVIAVAIYPESTAAEIVAALIAKGASVDKVSGYDSQTPLQYAVAAGGEARIEVVKALLDAGADVTAESSRATPLATALENANWPIAELLIQYKSDLAFTGRYGQTLLMTAIDNEAPRALFEKIAAAADLNANDGNPALHRAIAKEDPLYLDLLLPLDGLDVNIPDENGQTPLLSAVRQDRAEAAQKLVKAGADLNKGNDAGDRPLALAVGEGREDLAEMLIAAGAAVDLGNKKGAAPLTLAAQRGSVRLVKALLDAFEKKQEKPDLQPALFAAADKGQVQALEALLAAGANVNAVDPEGRTPLMKAARGNHVEALSTLLKAGAKPELTDAEGQQAYDHAVKSKKKQAREYLSRFRREPVKPRPAAPVAPESVYKALSKKTLEMRESDGLTMTFNFWTQQVTITRGAEKGAPFVVQNFADLQRQEAITEAYEKLKELGGDPPEPAETSLLKKHVGLGKG